METRRYILRATCYFYEKETGRQIAQSHSCSLKPTAALSITRPRKACLSPTRCPVGSRSHTCCNLHVHISHTYACRKSREFCPPTKLIRASQPHSIFFAWDFKVAIVLKKKKKNKKIVKITCKYKSGNTYTKSTRANKYTKQHSFKEK